MTLAPAPKFPERPGTVFEHKSGPPTANYNANRQGPNRFQEGLGTDTDIPNDFIKGMHQGWDTPPGQPNHNAPVYDKPAEETMRERAHAGSAAWIDSPDLLSSFAQASFTDYTAPQWEQVLRDGGRYQRQTPAVVTD